MQSGFLKVQLSGFYRNMKKLRHAAAVLESATHLIENTVIFV